MKALTIHQPWASLIAAGVKTIETRSWSTRHRGPLAIHAGKARPECTQWEDGPFDDIGPHQFGGWVNDDGHLVEDPWWLSLAPMHREYIRMPLGAVTAVANLVDVVPMIEGADEPPETGGFVYVDPDFIQLHADRDDSAPEYLEVERDLGNYRSGDFAWILAESLPLGDPVPAKGRQGLWEWEGVPT